MKEEGSVAAFSVPNNLFNTSSTAAGAAAIADKNVILVGNPNAGKSSLFNRLTGLNQTTGNFPGVTVERLQGKFTLPGGATAQLTDLPGAYSLHPTAADERVVLQTLAALPPEAAPTLVYVADVNQLERHLLLFSQLADLNFPLVLALNQIDTAKKAGISYNTQQLEKQLGISIVEVNARTGHGVQQLKAAIEKAASRSQRSYFKPGGHAPQLLQNLCENLPVRNPYHALLLAHHHKYLPHLKATERAQIAAACEHNNFNSLRVQIDETMSRYNLLEPLVHEAMVRQEQPTSFTERLDRVLMNKYTGPLIFALLMLLVFQAIFTWASYPMDFIEESFASAGAFVQEHVQPGWLSDLLANGILAGLAGVLVFVPQITILFVLITLLEEAGYMARVVFLFDKLLRKFGLNGRSVVSLISSTACAIPAVMAARSIGHRKQRLLTIFVAPLMSCSARIPVYTVLVALIVPATSVGIFNLQGLFVMGLYLLGTLAALLSAGIANKLLKMPESNNFFIELPDYQVPYWRNVSQHHLEPGAQLCGRCR